MPNFHIQPVNWSIEGYFTASSFVPANIQRDFQWTKHEIAQLLDDLADFIATDEPVYYLGPMVGTQSDQRKISIYDGLQRTTTLTILIAALRDRITDPVLKGRLNRCIKNEDDGSPRLTLSGNNNSLKTLVQDDDATIGLATGGSQFGIHRTIRDNRNVIVRRLDRQSEDELTILAKALLEKTEVIFVLTSSQSVAERIFDTTNRRGLSIETHDLIKSRLTCLLYTSPSPRDRG